MIAALNHLPAEGYYSTHKDSLLHIPNGILDEASLLVSRGDYLAGTNYIVKSFGLIDHNSYGDFCATVFGADPVLEATASASSVSSKATFNFMAHVDAPDDHQLLTASPMVSFDGQVAYGEAGYAPRIGPDGESYALLRVDDRIVLVKDGRTLLASGDNTAEGRILHIGTGSVGSDGLYYYSARTESADWTLFAFDGTEHVKILSSGDVLSEGGATVSRILFGTTKRHVDAQGRLAFCCSFTDGSTSLVVGIPS